MPLRNILCKKREEVVTFDECIECSRDNERFGCPFFPEFGRYVKEKAIDDLGRNLSVTRLLGCPRKAYLGQVIEYDVTLEDLWYLWRGTIMHVVLEGFKDDASIIETRFKWVVNGCEISFCPDKIDPERGILYDYKTVATVADSDPSEPVPSGSARDVPGDRPALPDLHRIGRRAETLGQGAESGGQETLEADGGSVAESGTARRHLAHAAGRRRACRQTPHA